MLLLFSLDIKETIQNHDKSFFSLLSIQYAACLKLADSVDSQEKRLRISQVTDLMELGLFENLSEYVYTQNDIRSQGKKYNGVFEDLK